METKPTTNGDTMTNALENRIALMTETEIVAGLRHMGDEFGFLDSGKWGDAERRVRAYLLCALEDHGWSDYRTDVLDAEIFWGSDQVDLVHAMNEGCEL